MLKAGGYAVAFRALEAGNAEIIWFDVTAGAQVGAAKHKHKPKPVIVASGHLTFAAPATGTLHLKLTPAGRQLLKHSEPIKLTAVGTFTPKGAAAVRRTAMFTLRQ